MASKLFQETQNNSNNSLMSRLKELKQNPMQFLFRNKLNVPQEYQNSPQDVVNYLVQSGQISQDQLNNAMRRANELGIKL